MLSKCDLLSQIIIALFNVHKWYVCWFASAKIRAPTVEFLKTTLISFLFHLHYYWFPGVHIISRNFAWLQAQSSFFPRDERCKRITEVFWLWSAATIYCRIDGNKYLSIRTTIAPLWRYIEGQRPGKLPYTQHTFPRRKIWNAARISELKLKSTFSRLRGGKDTRHHLLGDEIAFPIRHEAAAL